mmetsp:Transcript_69358/g.206554  ORF Transcript_69358/g.206554 Transcript_69358/m.206554 type:complete len:334 (+) Transcript_69358:106-1107(+)
MTSKTAPWVLIWTDACTKGTWPKADSEFARERTSVTRRPSAAKKRVRHSTAWCRQPLARGGVVACGLNGFGHVLKGLVAHRGVVQALALREGQGLPDGLEDSKDAAQALGVADSLVHAISDREGVDLALLIEEHALRLRRHSDLLAGAADLAAAKIQGPRVGAGGAGEEPDAVGLQGVDVEPRVVLEVRHCLPDLEGSKGTRELALRQGAHDGRDKLEVLGQAGGIIALLCAELRSQDLPGLPDELLRLDREGALRHRCLRIEHPVALAGSRKVLRSRGVALGVPGHLAPGRVLAAAADPVHKARQRLRHAGGEGRNDVPRQEDRGRCEVAND